MYRGRWRMEGASWEVRRPSPPGAARARSRDGCAHVYSESRPESANPPTYRTLEISCDCWPVQLTVEIFQLSPRFCGYLAALIVELPSAVYSSCEMAALPYERTTLLLQHSAELLRLPFGAIATGLVLLHRWHKNPDQLPTADVILCVKACLQIVDYKFEL